MRSLFDARLVRDSADGRNINLYNSFTSNTSLLSTLAYRPELNEIPACEVEADGLARNYLPPSQRHIRPNFHHHLVAIMDFIFNVDLSTVYVVLRRDFTTSQDMHGLLSSPVGAGFYCTQSCAHISSSSGLPL